MNALLGAETAEPEYIEMDGWGTLGNDEIEKIVSRYGSSSSATRIMSFSFRNFIVISCGIGFVNPSFSTFTSMPREDDR